MKYPKKRSNLKNKKKKIILLSILTTITASLGVIYIKKHNNLNNEILLDANSIVHFNNMPEDVIDIKDYTYMNNSLKYDIKNLDLLGSLIEGNFLYRVKSTAPNEAIFLILDKQNSLIDTITIVNEDMDYFELNNYTQLKNKSILLCFNAQKDDSTYSILYRYSTENGLEDLSNISNNKVIKVYSSNHSNDFIILEKDNMNNMNFIKYNSSLEELYKYNIGYNYFDSVVFMDNNKDYFIETVQNTSKIICINSSGKKETEITIPYENIIITKLIKTSDNGFLIGFKDNNQENPNETKSYITKINNKGNEIWSYYDISNTTTKEIYETENGYIVFNEISYYAEGNNGISSNLNSISKYSKSGVQEWTKYLGINDDYSSIIFSNEISNINNDFLINGILEDINNNDVQNIKMLIDINGNIREIENNAITDAVG